MLAQAETLQIVEKVDGSERRRQQGSSARGMDRDFDTPAATEWAVMVPVGFSKAEGARREEWFYRGRTMLLLGCLSMILSVGCNELMEFPGPRPSLFWKTLFKFMADLV